MHFFYLNTVGQTQYTFINPYLTIKILQLLYTSGLNVKV